MVLSFFVVAMKTGPVVRRRYTSRTTPARLHKPATPPRMSARTW